MILGNWQDAGFESKSLSECHGRSDTCSTYGASGFAQGLNLSQSATAVPTDSLGNIILNDIKSKSLSECHGRSDAAKTSTAISTSRV